MNTTAVTPFDFESKSIRTVIENDQVLFVAIDVAEALGYKHPKDAVYRHCKGAMKRRPLQTAGGVQEIRVIYEPDVYRLIVGSQLPSAQRFEKWLFEEVLPSIRKTGSYVTPSAEPIPTWQGPSSQQCELCELENRKFIWNLQGRLLAKDQLWNDIRKYHAKNLTNQEISKLVGLGRAALRRQMRAMEECGLLCPRNKRELSRMYGPDMWHKYAIPMNYGVLQQLAKQERQMELFPVGALGVKEA